MNLTEPRPLAGERTYFLGVFCLVHLLHFPFQTLDVELTYRKVSDLSGKRQQTSDILNANQSSNDPGNIEKTREFTRPICARGDTYFPTHTCGPLESQQNNGIRYFTSTQPSRGLDLLHPQSRHLASDQGVVDATEIHVHG